MGRWGASSIGALLLAIPASSAIAKEPPNLSELMIRARREHKAVVLDFGIEPCEPCKVVDREVLPLPRVKAALAKVIFQVYDGQVGRGEAAGERLNVRAYPTFVALRPDGGEIARQEGVDGADDLLAFLERARRAALDGPTLLAALERKPSAPDILLDLGNWHVARGELETALDYFRRARAAAGQRSTALAAEVDWQMRWASLRLQLAQGICNESAAHAREHPGSVHANSALRAAAMCPGRSANDDANEASHQVARLLDIPRERISFSKADDEVAVFSAVQPALAKAAEACRAAAAGRASVEIDLRVEGEGPRVTGRVADETVPQALRACVLGHLSGVEAVVLGGAGVTLVHEVYF